MALQPEEKIASEPVPSVEDGPAGSLHQQTLPLTDCWTSPTSQGHVRWSDLQDEQDAVEDESTTASEVGGIGVVSDDDKNRELSTASQSPANGESKQQAARGTRQSGSGCRGDSLSSSADESMHPVWYPAAGRKGSFFPMQGHVHPPDAASCGAIVALPGAALPRPHIVPDVLQEAVERAKASAAQHQAWLDQYACQTACYTGQYPLTAPPWPGNTMMVIAAYPPHPTDLTHDALKCSSCGGPRFCESSELCGLCSTACA